MTISIKNAKTNAITDWTQPQLDTIIAGGAPPLPPPGTTLSQVVLPSDWNATLTTSMATGKLLGRSTVGAGSFEEISIGSGLSLSGGSLSASGGSGSPGGSNTQVQFNDSGSFGGSSFLTLNKTTGALTNQYDVCAIELDEIDILGVKFPRLLFTDESLTNTGLIDGGMYLRRAPSLYGSEPVLIFADETLSNYGAITQTFTNSTMTIAPYGSVLFKGAGGKSTAYSLVDINSSTGGILTLSRNDTSVTANDVIGQINFWSNDTSTTTNPLAAMIQVTAKNTITTDTNAGVMKFYTTPTGVAAALALALTLDESQNATFAGSILSPSLTGTPTAPTATANDNSTKIATTAYVDNAILSQNYKEAVRVATTANLVGTYLNGASGVGATFTYTATGADSVDGVTLVLGDRILLKNQTSGFQNGIYTVTTAGAIGVAGILTRATDADQAADWKTGDMVFVTAGTTLTSTTWAYTAIDSPTMGTTSLTFVQVAGQGSFTGGTGITITGTSIAIDTSITVDKTTAQTLTNKTLTAPIISTISNTGTLTLPTSTDTLIGRATTDTLTNKRIQPRTVTVNAPGATPTTNTDNGDCFEFTGLAAAITSMTTNLSGTPVNNEMVEFIFLDNGTARAITWGASFSNGGLANLPTTTVISTILRVLVQYQTISSLNKWVCIAVS